MWFCVPKIAKNTYIIVIFIPMVSMICIWNSYLFCVSKFSVPEFKFCVSYSEDSLWIYFAFRNLNSLWIYFAFRNLNFAFRNLNFPFLNLNFAFLTQKKVCEFISRFCIYFSVTPTRHHTMRIKSMSSFPRNDSYNIRKKCNDN